MCSPRVLFAVLLVAASIVVPGVSARADSPTIPANRPTPLPGAVNGVVPRSRLVQVGSTCFAAREAGPSLARLFALAREYKVSLGADECYRPLALQVQYANQAAQPGNNPACVASVSRTSSGAPVGNSYHGWGKAADLTDAGQSLTFSSPGYWFMKQFAASVGWNHPAFAEPGGSTCPEPWHWEWVGDGGNLHRSTVRGDVVALLPSASGRGYAVVDGLGGVEAHGDFVSHGAATSIPIAWNMAAAAATPSRNGYWMIGGDGGVFAFGGARFYGSTASIALAQPVNGIAPTPSGRGYWLIAWDGGVFSFGDARFHGSTGAIHLNSPVDGIAPTRSGNGYWLVAADGGVFAFGDARFRGSMGGRHLVAPVSALAPTRSGQGYWMLASDGGVFSFGDARFFGSAAGTSASPAISLVATPSGNGYWITRADGTVAAFGDAATY